VTTEGHRQKDQRGDMKKSKANFELIDEVFCAIAKKQAKLGEEALSEPEKVVGTVWQVSGIVENGGLFYFFEHTYDVEEVAQRYEVIGIPMAASILRKAIAKFPNSRTPPNFKACMKFLDEHEEFFESLSTEFWETQEKDLEKKLAKYIRQHPEAFADFFK
jgi:hypothetical protein